MTDSAKTAMSASAKKDAADAATNESATDDKPAETVQERNAKIFRRIAEKKRADAERQKQKPQKPQKPRPFLPSWYNNVKKKPETKKEDKEEPVDKPAKTWVERMALNQLDKPQAPVRVTEPQETDAQDSGPEYTEAQKAYHVKPAPDNSYAEMDKSGLTVTRTGGGKTWQDRTLLEWNPAHFRVFVGNLAGEVTDESLAKHFSMFPSMVKARVVRDAETKKSKGYGFLAFSDGEEYFRAVRDNQGVYIGNRPVTLAKAKTSVKPSNIGARNERGGNRRARRARQNAASAGPADAAVEDVVNAEASKPATPSIPAAAAVHPASAAASVRAGSGWKGTASTKGPTAAAHAKAAGMSRPPVKAETLRADNSVAGVKRSKPQTEGGTSKARKVMLG